MNEDFVKECKQEGRMRNEFIRQDLGISSSITRSDSGTQIIGQVV